ncbi:hypothetical protein ACFQU7_21715 [Pseudoroseomonas wenyumeiae]
MPPLPAERTDPEAWEALWRRERDLARRARLLAVPAEEVGRKLQLLYGVPAERLREVPRVALPRLLAAVPRPRRPRERRRASPWP